MNVTFQLSLGRFPAVIDGADSIRNMKKKIRFATPPVAHVNFNLFRVNYDGAYLSDESKTVLSYGIAEGAVLHFVKKSTCPAAAFDSEKKTDE
jgi:hypothetical protein